MGSWANDIPLTFVIPAGAVSGERIVLNGVTGQIQVYASDNTLVGQIDAAGVEYFNANGAYVRLYEGQFGGVITPFAEGAIVAMQPPNLTGANFYPGIINAGSATVAGVNYGSILMMPPVDQITKNDAPRMSMDGETTVGAGGTFLFTNEGSNAAGEFRTDMNVVFSPDFGGTVKDNSGNQFTPNNLYNFNGFLGGSQVVNATAYANLTGVVTPTFNKIFAGTQIVVRVSGAGFASTLGGGFNLVYGVRLNGTDYDVGAFHFNSASVHAAFSGERLISGLPAAFYGSGAQVRVKVSAAAVAATCDFNDYWSITIQEVSA